MNRIKTTVFNFRVPDAVVLKKHVLVMAFIGDDGRPAPKLKAGVYKVLHNLIFFPTIFLNLDFLPQNCLINLLQAMIC